MAGDRTSASVRVVQEYLDGSAARRHDSATKRLADSFTIESPLGRFTSLDDLWEASAAHYRGVTKHYSSWDVFERFGDTVVVVAGTLTGESANGRPFAGVRYMDRIVLRDGQIVLHQFWNDLAAASIVAPVSTPKSRLLYQSAPRADTQIVGVIADMTRFQTVCCKRQVADARAFVAPGARFVFPVGELANVDAVVGSLRRRFRWVEKVHDSWDVAIQSNGATTVIDLGTVRGETASGIPFSDVRFADRLLLRDGKVVLLEVWNDMAYRVPVQQER